MSKDVKGLGLNLEDKLPIEWTMGSSLTRFTCKERHWKIREMIDTFVQGKVTERRII